MSKTEETLSPAEILEWATKDFVLAETKASLVSTNEANAQGQMPYGVDTSGIWISGAYSGTSETYSIFGNFPLLISRYQNDGNRRIGFISGVNTDGSFNLYILGNGGWKVFPTHFVNTLCKLGANGRLRLLPPATDLYFPEHASDFGNYIYEDNASGQRWGFAYDNLNIEVGVNQAFDYSPQWKERVSSRETCNVFYNTMFINDVMTIPDPYTQDIELSTNIADTVQIGKPITAKYWQRSQSGWYFGDKNIGGDIFDFLDSMGLSLVTSIANTPASLSIQQLTAHGYSGDYDGKMISTYQPFEGSYAFNYTPYNLILTYNLDEAKRYVETGELPSDAFLYPFDVDNIPVNETGGTGAEDSDGTQADDTISTGGDSGGEETDDQTPEAPTNTPQALTNNNLYWLTSQQLKGFIEWFWTDATDVTDPQELFEKIQGLYSDLSQAIVSIRYMPIDAEWVGGTTIDNSIIVGLVEKTEQVRTINKTVAPIRDIATDISISELPDFKGFINFSPYCEISLYLPFYGYLSLDADLLMQNKLTIKATYDILSGTIQYYIFRVSSKTGNATMINTVTGKMAVDIPISLQTKNERDSMIFNNVASATANLIGAGASAVAGNPIGMVMSTSAIAGQQSQGAPMRVMGTIGESGAFYDHGYCAIFIKRPATNYPPQYARRVGYPYNGARKLEKTHGFIQCFNPYVEFTHMTVNDSDIQPPKPTAEEIETIYNALEEGVILP